MIEPSASLDGLLRPGPVLVLAPHPDDEALGCGELLASCWAEGRAAHVACLTDGSASHPGSRAWPPHRLARLRRAEMGAAIAHLGGDPARDLTWLGHPDAGCHRMGTALAADVGRVVDRTGARTLVAPSPLDPHCDHEAGAAAAVAVAGARTGLRLLFYPVWSRWVADGAAPRPLGTRRHAFAAPAHRAAKRRAIAAHASQAGRVVRDAPDGFVLPCGFAAMFLDGPELFDELLEVPAWT